MRRVGGAILLGVGIAIASAYPFCIAFFCSGYLRDGKGAAEAFAGAAGYSVMAVAASAPLSIIAGGVIGLGVGIASSALKGRHGIVTLIASAIGTVAGTGVMMFLRSLKIPFGAVILDFLPAYSGAIAGVAAYHFERRAHEPRDHSESS